MSKKNAKVNNKRWAAYAAAGVAATLAGTQSAEADITLVTLGAGNGGDWDAGANLLFSLGGAGTLNFSNATIGPDADAAYFEVLGGNAVGTSTANPGFQYASNLSSGANISGGNFISGPGTLAYGIGYANEQFIDVGGFLGFSFNGGTQFGWASLTSTGTAGDSSNTYTIEAYAYGDVGDSVVVGQGPGAVPEPTSLGLLALGAIGVAANRRRKKIA